MMARDFDGSTDRIDYGNVFDPSGSLQDLVGVGFHVHRKPTHVEFDHLLRVARSVILQPVPIEVLDIISGKTPTYDGSAVIEHPRIIYPG